MGSSTQKGFANIALVMVIVVLVGIAGYFVLIKKLPQPITQQTPTTTPENLTSNWTQFKIDSGAGGGEELVGILPKIEFKYPERLLTKCAPAGPFPNLISKDLDPEKCWYQPSEVSRESFVAQLGSFGHQSDPPVLNLKQWRIEEWAPDYKPGKDTILEEGTINGIDTLEERTPTKVTTYLATGTGRVYSFSHFPISPKNEALYQSILSTFKITASPTIISLLPVSGPVGASVAITGNGFTATGNKVKFGDLGSENNPSYSLNSSDGKTVVFPVPSSNYLSCWYSTPACGASAYSTQPGIYGISVINANGTSNEISFTVMR